MCVCVCSRVSAIWEDSTWESIASDLISMVKGFFFLRKKLEILEHFRFTEKLSR